MTSTLSHLRIIIRGAGDIASGTAWRLHRSGFFRLLMTEVATPLAVRRKVSFCEAIYDGSAVVDGIKAVGITHPEQVEELWGTGIIPVIADPLNRSREIIRPDVLVDGILAKRNLGTSITDAPLVIALGPGFCAGTDVHCVVETNRGHDLGRLISDGYAEPDTGIPGDVGGHSIRRLIRAPADGIFESNLDIGAMVEEGDVVGSVSGADVRVQLTGVVRGLIRPGTKVNRGLKIGDVDPRGNRSSCYTVSDKARSIGGGVLEAILAKFNTRD